MNKNFTLSALLVLFFSASGCGSIKHTTDVKQSIGTPFMVGIGDAAYTATLEKSLPNLFGKADLYGRTTPTGKVQVVYAGVKDGVAKFVRSSVDIETGATTMNSSPIVIPNRQRTSYSGVIGGASYSGTSTTTGASTVIPANTPDAEFYNSQSLIISIPLVSLHKSIFVNERKLTILEADEYSAKVQLEK